MDESPAQRSRRLACRRCYRHKLRCERDTPNAAKCARCSKLGLICEDRLERSMGRPRGSRSDLTESSSDKPAMRSSEHDVGREAAQRSFPRGAMRDMTIATDSLGERPQQHQDDLSMPHAALDPQLQHYRGSYGVDIYGVDSDVVDPSHTDSSAVESLKSEEHIGGTAQTPAQRAYWGHQVDFYQSAGTQTFTPEQRGHGLETTIHPPTKSRPFLLNSTENCIDALSDLQKVLIRQQRDAIQSDPLIGFDLSEYPFANRMTPEILQDSIRRLQAESRTSFDPFNQPLGFENPAKRIFAASHLFLELIQALAHLSIRSRSYQSGATSTIAGSTTPLETSLMAISCYLRILSLFNSIAESLAALRQRQISGDAQLLSSMNTLTTTSNLSSTQPQLSALTAAVGASAELVGPVVHLTSYLIKVIDESMREYLSTALPGSTGGTPLRVDPALTGLGQQEPPPVNDELTSAIQGILQPTMLEAAILRGKLVRSLRQCESFQIATR